MQVIASFFAVSYRKIAIISPGLIFVQKAFSVGLYLGSLFSEGLIIGGNFAFQNGLDLTMKTVSTKSPWAYIWEGLLSEGYLRLRCGGLIFRRAYFWGAYYQNFTVRHHLASLFCACTHALTMSCAVNASHCKFTQVPSYYKLENCSSLDSVWPGLQIGSK